MVVAGSQGCVCPCFLREQDTELRRVLMLPPPPGMSSGFPLSHLTSLASFSDFTVTLRVQLWGFCSLVEQDGTLPQPWLTISLAYTRGGLGYDAKELLWPFLGLSLGLTKQGKPSSQAGWKERGTALRLGSGSLRLREGGSDFSKTTCEYSDVHSA